MYLSYQQTITLCTQQKEDLISCVATTPHKLIVCPILPAINELTTLISHSQINFGAQTCSPHKLGAYTGEIDAQSLSELGCTYCIIGHSERRHYHHETNDIVAQQAMRLIEQGITPIFCVGETLDEKKLNQTLQVVQHQVEPMFQAIKQAQKISSRLTIAYEPIWAIGSNQIPEIKDIETAVAAIKSLGQEILPEIDISCLYGGSVDENSIKTLKSLKYLDGFLIGRASLDFQRLQKIVSWFKQPGHGE